MTVSRSYKGSGWAAAFRMDGRRIRRQGFKTRKEAQDWEAGERLRLAQEQPQKILLTFADIYTRYLEECDGRMTANTIRQKVFVGRDFVEFCRENPAVSDVTPQIVSQYLAERRRTAGTKAANRRRRDLSAGFAWAVSQGLVGRNPCLPVKPYPEDPYIKYVPPAADISAVLLAASGDDLDLLTSCYYTAGRIGELLNLTWENVNFEHRSLRLWTKKRRGGVLEPRDVAMAQGLLNLLRERWETRDTTSPYVFTKAGTAGPYSYQSKRSLLAKLCEKAQVKPFGFHAIRHHVSAILADSGKATLRQIQSLLGHQRATTTDLYLKGLSPDQRLLAGVLDSVFPQSGQPSGQPRVVNDGDS